MDNREDFLVRLSHSYGSLPKKADIKSVLYGSIMVNAYYRFVTALSFFREFFIACYPLQFENVSAIFDMMQSCIDYLKYSIQYRDTPLQYCIAKLCSEGKVMDIFC